MEKVRIQREIAIQNNKFTTFNEIIIWKSFVNFLLFFFSFKLIFLLILFYLPCVYSLNTNFVVPFFGNFSMVINLCCVRKINCTSHIYLVISCKTPLLYVHCIDNCYFFM